MTKKTTSDKLIYTLLNRLPQNLVSRSFGAIADIELPPPVQGIVNKGFAALTSIDVDESELPPEEYPSLNSFFTRRLHSEARSPASDLLQDVLSPVDGRLDQFGKIQKGTLIQAKGRDYTVRSLLDSYDHASIFDEGSFATLYLSPRDYHRVHSAVTGEISEVSYIPGRLWPVKPWAVQNVDELFAVNERIVSYIETESFGRVASVMVGATCVGRMTLAFGDFKTNTSFRRREDTPLSPPVAISAGDELGCFNLGSTVILLFEREVAFSRGLSVGKSLQMGEKLADI